LGFVYAEFRLLVGFTDVEGDFCAVFGDIEKV
jgi:hypothetical protein